MDFVVRTDEHIPLFVAFDLYLVVGVLPCVREETNVRRVLLGGHDPRKVYIRPKLELRIEPDNAPRISDRGCPR